MISLVKQLFVSFFKILDSFFNDDTTYYAASLSFFTIFSLLPILALLIAIITYLDVTAEYLDVFLNYIVDILNPTSSEQFREFIISFLSNSNKLGSLGILYMLFVFGMFFKDYEYIVNMIHGSKRRSFMKATLLYVASLFILPTLIIIFFIGLSYVGDDSVAVKILSFFFAWFLMFVFFKVSASYKLNLGAVTISSFATTIVLSITKNLFVYYVIYNKTYTTIYGSLSTLLFFFFWIYISWLIYLYGVKFCSELHRQFAIPKKTESD